MKKVQKENEKLQAQLNDLNTTILKFSNGKYH